MFYFFKGIELNFEFFMLMKVVELVCKEEIGFIFVVGGGLVIDGIKFILGVVGYEGDLWEVFM